MILLLPIFFLCGIGFTLLAGWLLDPNTSFGPLRREIHAWARTRQLADVILDREVELKGNPFVPIERPTSPAWRGPHRLESPVGWQWFLKHRKQLQRQFDKSAVKLLQRKEIAA